MFAMGAFDTEQIPDENPVANLTRLSHYEVNDLESH